MAAVKVLRGMGVMGCLAMLLLLATAGDALAAHPSPQTQLTQVQSQLSSLVAPADVRAKGVLRTTVDDLERATAESLWIDPSDAVPPPNGNAVFTASSEAVREIAAILNDHSVSLSALLAASGEILQAQADLANNALAQVRTAPSGVGAAPFARWQLAFAQLGQQTTQAVTTLSLPAVEQAAEAYLASTTDELFAIPQQITGSPLTVQGRPEFFVWGSEGCPYCGIDRWSIVVALAQFGEFAPLAVTVSSTYDLDPATRTFRFSNTHYASPYVAFVPVDEWSNQPGGTLRCFGETFPWWTETQAPTPDEQGLINQYDTFEGCLEALPFLDVANKWATLGSYPNPAVISALSWEQIARSLSNPGSVVAQVIDGGAEIIAAQICSLDGERPARVCNSRTAQKYQEVFTP